MLYSLLYTALAIQWNLQIKDTLGPTVLSAIERSSSRRSMENNNYYKLCLVERLSSSRGAIGSTKTMRVHQNVHYHACSQDASCTVFQGPFREMIAI